MKAVFYFGKVDGRFTVSFEVVTIYLNALLMNSWFLQQKFN